jgi:hypothetical protein
MTNNMFLYIVAFGALGGFASYLLILFSGFEKLPSSIPDQTTPMALQRVYFCVGRMLFGIATAIITCMFFIDSYLAAELSKYKLLGYVAVAGFSVSTLSQIAKVVKVKG